MERRDMSQAEMCRAVRDTVQAAEPQIYGDVRKQIQTGDLFMFSGEGVGSKLIRSISHSNYSHCGIAAWWKDSLMVIQADSDGIEARPVSEKIYGTSRTRIEREDLRKEVGGYNGQVDWYRVTWPEVNDARREALLRAAINLLGGDFATLGLLRVGVLTLAQSIRGKADYRRHPAAMFCSQFVSAALVEARWPDPVGDVPHHLTSPEHLVSSGLYALGAPIHTKGTARQAVPATSPG